jgi:hypothetical protein
MDAKHHGESDALANKMVTFHIFLGVTAPGLP